MKSWVKMNSWTSEDTKAVKTWFDLDKYREFENISINMLYHEIWARTYFFKPVIEEGMQKTVLKIICRYWMVILFLSKRST